ncbi:MAG: CHAT domain-containing protein [bacterium]|nr:CHAT domain-containing protein [bacterium]
MPTSSLGPAAEAFRGDQLARAAASRSSDAERYAQVLEADGLLSRERARRREVFAVAPVAEKLGRLQDELAYWITVSPVQRIVDFRDPRFRVEVSGYSRLDATEELTWSVWLWLDGENTVHDAKIVSHAGVSKGKIALMLAPDNRPILALNLAGGQVARVVWRRKLPAGSWIHLALVYRCDRGPALFVDGERLTETVYDDEVAPGDCVASVPQQTLYLGGLDRVLPGALDEVRVYRRALDEREVAELAAGRAVARDLVGHWSFDEPAGATSAENGVAGGTNGVVGTGVVTGEPGAPAVPGRAFRFSRSADQWNRRLSELQAAIAAREREALAAEQPVAQDAFDLGDVADRLLAAEAVLLHLVEDAAQDRLVAYVVDPERAGLVRRVELGSLRDTVDLVDALIEQLGGAAAAADGSEIVFREIARRLSSRIWRPVANRIPSERETWLRLDGQLARVPFAALIDRDGRYLAQSRTLARVGPVRELARPRVADPSAAVVLVGNAEFGAYAPAAGPSTRGARECVVSSWQLAGTSRELEGLEELFRRETERPVHVFESRRAFEANVLESASGAGVLHVATHGYQIADSCVKGATDDPLVLGGVVLAGAGRTRPESLRRVDDGFLSGAELSRIDLRRAELVAFSGCSTARGRVVPGDGAQSLALAAWIAGAGASLVTLWEVDDETMSEDMIAFYTAWLEGHSLASALRAATSGAFRRTKEERDHTHPYYWAAPTIEGL